MSYKSHEQQLDLFAVSFDVQGQAKIVIDAPAASAPVVAPIIPVAKQPTHTITHDPLKGYKVVMAPGLTASQRNPCLSCSSFGRNMDACSEHCKHAAARSSYLEGIGMGGVLCGVDGEGLYGFGC